MILPAGMLTNVSKATNNVNFKSQKMKTLHEIDRDKIARQFKKETGITEPCEIQDAFPVFLGAHILLQKREFECTLTPSGTGIKKGTLKEIA